MTNELHLRHYPVPTTDGDNCSDVQPLVIGETSQTSHLLSRHLSLQDTASNEPERKTRNTADRLRQVKIFCGVLAVVISVLTFFSFINQNSTDNVDIIPIEHAQEHFLTIPNTNLKLWYRVWGETGGMPVLFVHGGPGNAIADYENENKQFFDDSIFFVVSPDQRGTGKSQPSVRDDWKNMQYYKNISIDMIADDYELIRKELNIHKWLVWGGSFGSTVTLTYARRHSEHCAGLILRGIYLESTREVGEVYSRRSYLDNPKRLHEFDILYDYAAGQLKKTHKPKLNPDDAEGIMRVYENLIQRGDRYAVWHWWTFENNLMEWDPAHLQNPYEIDDVDYPQAQSVAFFETRLWIHGTYEAPTFILDHLKDVARLPIWICQGLKDEVCPYENAERLVDALREAGANQLTERFIDTGHEQSEPVMAKCLHL
jgi:proline iminopeptidase